MTGARVVIVMAMTALFLFLIGVLEHEAGWEIFPW